jgi:hypothetical protein
MRLEPLLLIPLALLVLGAQTPQSQFRISQIAGLEKRLRAAENVSIVETWNLTSAHRDFHISEYRYSQTVMVWRDNRLLAGCIDAPIQCEAGYEWLLDGAYVRLVTAAQPGARVTIRHLMAAEHLNGLNLVMNP